MKKIYLIVSVENVKDIHLETTKKIDAYNKLRKMNKGSKWYSEKYEMKTIDFIYSVCERIEDDDICKAEFPTKLEAINYAKHLFSERKTSQYIIGVKKYVNINNKCCTVFNGSDFNKHEVLELIK